ncbi:putative electron transfer flavoprotein-ubiquinone oxidoreductase, mitochondrial [Lodderomyces elongisporus]|uniref:putative electron transfer flavoprotein-ubiquinone oxidoreductase, mitochondrial n=1 Tax=Lodderomyces elongisporus TaxID=36914 RepID=UPI00291ED1A6|nr:putative electron transfer flavoprotein-ubiquinone oxidoreductase, mitochondrial [Lodderomyces elongisporus]WLF80754.1 putative electron transfer flavoprotein-ubiquinone oxidoreductase, mitochondrial [Lodderomyces elongisporus]
MISRTARISRGFKSQLKSDIIHCRASLVSLPILVPPQRAAQLPSQSRYLHQSSLRLNTTTTATSSTASPNKLTQEQLDILNQERATDQVDVCIIGGGPAGLATAIKLKQLDNEHGSGEKRVIVLEKAGDFGSHIVSGAVIEPQAFRELFPDATGADGNDENIPLPEDMVTLVTEDNMKYLTSNSSFPLIEPPQLHNKGKNYIVSLNNVVKYLSEQAEELGVELYPGISVSEVLYNDAKDTVIGVATQDMGIDKSGAPKDSFEKGMEFHARMTVFAEGCHGSLSKQLINHFKLRENSDPQTYGLGIKEVWEVSPEKFKKGYVGHSLGFPLTKESAAYGGGFIYHFGEGLVAVGLVIGLDYKNPYISPYQEFQKMKTHPYYKDTLEGGKCISYAARALNEGGYQSIPKLYFPGGILVGCSAGFLNVPKIKGTHTAVKSGILAAESIYNRIRDQEEVEEEQTEEEMEDLDEEEQFFKEITTNPIVLSEYEEAFRSSWAYDELYRVRNVRPSFNTPLGVLGGLAHAGLTTMVTQGKEPWTLHTKHTDSAATELASAHKPIAYPKPDNEITFDILTSVSRTGTYHDEDEQCHLRVPKQDLDAHAKLNWEKYQGVEQKFCPAGVYEYVENDKKELGVEFKINSQNCIHCKTCDIKVPSQDINWTVPEGGDGPKYYMT